MESAARCCRREASGNNVANNWLAKDAERSGAAFASPS